MTEVKKKVPTKADLERENKDLRQQLKDTASAITMAAGVRTQPQTTPSAVYGSTAPMVGIRNVSDNTVGVPVNIPGEPSVTLHAALGGHDPNSVAIISYAAWLAVRSSKLVGKGIIVRDDRVLAGQFVAAPLDREDQIPEEAVLNQIEDPTVWIEKRDEIELRDDIRKITSDDSLRRLRRAVTIRLKEIEAGYPTTMVHDDRVRQSYRDLPMRYQLVETLTTELLERPDSM